MNCQDHPDLPATGSCRGCAEGFCGDCLVTVRGSTYCAACKEMALDPNLGPVQTSGEATEALRYALVGLVFCGMILEPVALYKSMKALGELRENPRMVGKGRATAAALISCVGLLLTGVQAYAKSRGM